LSIENSLFVTIPTTPASAPKFFVVFEQQDDNGCREGADKKSGREKEFIVDDLVDRIHLIIVMRRLTGLAP